MKTKILLVVAALSLLLAGVAGAVGSTTLDSTVTVLARCSFKSSGSVAFGNVDPSTGAAVVGAVVQPTFKCTKGTAYTISNDTGQNGSGGNLFMKLTTGADLIKYSIAYTAAGSAVAGPSQNMDITAGIAAGDYQDAAAGNYTDQVTLTINP